MSAEFRQDTETKGFTLVETVPPVSAQDTDLNHDDLALPAGSSQASEASQLPEAGGALVEKRTAASNALPAEAVALVATGADSESGSGGRYEPVSYVPHSWTSSPSSNIGFTASDDALVGAWKMIWETRGRQIFNAVYFACACFSLWIIAGTCSYLTGPAWAVIAFFGALTFCAVTYAIFHRAPVSSGHEFSPTTQKNLRRFALITPALLTSFAIWNCVAIGMYVYYTTDSSRMTGLGSTYSEQNEKLLDMMMAASPFNTTMLEPEKGLAMNNKLYEKALMLQDKLIALKPGDSNLKIQRLLPLGLIPGREAEFESTKDQYLKLYGGDGYLYSTLYELAMARRNFPLALEMAGKHVQIHNKEAGAYRQRSSAYSQLGLTAEGDADEAIAKSLEAPRLETAPTQPSPVR